MAISGTTVNVSSTTGVNVVDPDNNVNIMLVNLDANFTVYLANIPAVNPGANSSDNVPLPAGATIVLDGTTDSGLPWYAATMAGQSVQLAVIPGGVSFFQFVEIIVKTIILAASLGNGLFVYSGTPGPSDLIGSWVSAATTDKFGTHVPAGLSATVGNINGTIITPATIPASAVNFTATAINGIETFVQGTTPVGANNGSLWINTSQGNALYQLTGGVWSLYQFGQGSIQANSITAAQIAANTITVSQLAAGIIYAGIVNGTTITAATFVGGTFEGTDFFINANGIFFYSGTPASGNLTGSWTNSNSDGIGNTTYPTFASYGSNSVSQLSSGFIEIFQLANIPANKGGMILGAFGPATQEIVMTSGNVGATDHAAAIGLISSSTPEILMTLNAVAILDLLASGSTLNSALTVTGTSVLQGGLNIPANAAQHFGVDLNGLIYLIGTAGHPVRALAQQSGDANNRWQMDQNGRQDWGDGTNPTDVGLLRSSAGTLEITQSLAILNSLQVIVNTILGNTTVAQIDRTISGVLETWHSLGTFPTAGVTTVTGRYRLMADGDVEIDILLSTAAAVATFSANFPNTLPAAYLPTQTKICAIGATGASWTISGSRMPNCVVNTAGAVQINMPAIPGAVANIGCTFRYPTT